GGGLGTGHQVLFQNITVEDPRPTLQHFFLLSKTQAPYTVSPESREAGQISDVVFRNIDIAAPSVLGEKEIILGAKGREFTKLTFDNVKIAGKTLKLKDFKVNQWVQGLIFK
ncbi:MAG: endo-polygalacturonase, partial [Planctomycetes bacterium]|nr:endo-polygalacturonase [Planctomycetota bacterium]